MSLSKSSLTTLIKNKALEIGFDLVGISEASYLKDDKKRLKEWLKNGYQAKMSYMERNEEKRVDPRLLVEGTKSVISLLINYYPNQKQPADTYQISKYLYGQDYHLFVKKRLRLLETFIFEQTGSTLMRSFVDSAPVLEKSWAQKSGLGWVGKHSLLINEKLGSFFFIAEIFTELQLDCDEPYLRDRCGTCTKCIDACPTGALKGNRIVNANRCISFVNKRREDIPEDMKGQLHNWIYGCDICQDVCPWNKHVIPSLVEETQPSVKLFSWGKDEFESLTKDEFKSAFYKSAIKFDVVQRNIQDILEKK